MSVTDAPVVLHRDKSLDPVLIESKFSLQKYIVTPLWIMIVAF